MKFLKGIIALLPLAVTAAVLPFMPVQVPMHYDVNGNIDRMGSRYELLLLPLLIILIVYVSVFVTKHYAKRSESANDSEAKSAKANIRVLSITSLAVPVIFGALQCGVLYMTYRNANADSVAVNSRFIVRLAFILVGMMCIGLGSLMPKTEINHFFGFRVTWSMYNDNTWKKSNRLGGICFAVIGLLMIVTAALAPVTLVAVLSVGYLLAATIILLIYAHRIYREEKEKDETST